MDFKSTDCFTVIGTRGCGKSYLAREINDLFPRSVVIDPVNDWKNGEIVTSFHGLVEQLTEKKRTNAKKFRIIFRFDPDESNTEEIFNHVLRICFHFKNIQIVIDEVQLFTNPHYLPKYFQNLLFIGRHNGLSVMCITQRPSQLNKSILSQSSHVYCGQLHEKKDLKSISSFINEDINKLINLKPRNFIYFSPGKPNKLISTEK